MRLAVGSDHRGFAVKAKVVNLLTQLGHEVTDVGTHAQESVDYPEFAAAAARKVAEGEVDRGVLMCGSGIGMCIAANKVPGARAATCHDEITAELSRRHNDVNVLCLSADMLGDSSMGRVIEIWLKTEFEGGRHARRVEKISEIERRGEPGT
ncbi:MAG: ribose 5-phosphate isomerase B [Planctomycetales bacterium]